VRVKYEPARRYLGVFRDKVQDFSDDMMQFKDLVEGVQSALSDAIAAGSVEEIAQEFGLSYILDKFHLRRINQA